MVPRQGGDRHALPARGPGHSRRYRPAGHDPLAPRRAGRQRVDDRRAGHSRRRRRPILQGPPRPRRPAHRHPARPRGRREGRATGAAPTPATQDPRILTPRPSPADQRPGERVGVMLRLLAFVLPLGVDSFVVAAALGAAGLTGARERLRVSLIFVLFEAGMPLVGLAGAAVIALGIYMLVAG